MKTTSSTFNSPYLQKLAKATAEKSLMPKSNSRQSLYWQAKKGFSRSFSNALKNGGAQIAKEPDYTTIASCIVRSLDLLV